MARKKEVRKPVCGQCMEPIDERSCIVAAMSGLEYIHACGRVLVKGRENAEVPTTGLVGHFHGEHYNHAHILGEGGLRHNHDTGDA